MLVLIDHRIICEEGRESRTVGAEALLLYSDCLLEQTPGIGGLPLVSVQNSETVQSIRNSGVHLAVQRLIYRQATLIVRFRPTVVALLVRDQTNLHKQGRDFSRSDPIYVL